MKTFSEPRMVIFANPNHSETAQGFVVAEKSVIFEIGDFTIIKGLIQLIATYYTFHVSYPKSVPARSFLLFIQEFLLEQRYAGVKHTARYKDFVNLLKD